MKICIISDNHSNYDFEVPDADVLIHCGDFSFKGNPIEMMNFRDWITKQPHTHKLFIWGNHEKIEQQELYWRDYIEYETGAKCIHNLQEPIDVDGLKICGSSYTPTFGRWAFMMDDEQRKRYWENAPDCDILVSHGPPYGLLDTVEGLEIEPGKLENLGCIHLRKYIERIKPKLVCFGHIHSSYGQMNLKHWDGTPDTICVNASLMDENYKITGTPMVIEI